MGAYFISLSKDSGQAEKTGQREAERERERGERERACVYMHGRLQVMTLGPSMRHADVDLPF